jgi:RNA polymerase sigma factor (sigma-70 family)
MDSSSDNRAALAWLLARIAAQDTVAFAELYRRASPRLLGVSVRMLGDRSEAEEVLQEVFIAVWRRAQSFDPALSSPMTWLVALTRNKSIDRLRQRREQPAEDPIDLEAQADERFGPAVAAENSHEYHRLQRCLDELDPRSSRSVREAYFSGATYKELAERCRVPLGTMKSWIRRALLQLRTCMES